MSDDRRACVTCGRLVTHNEWREIDACPWCGTVRYYGDPELVVVPELTQLVWQSVRHWQRAGVTGGITGEQ